MGEPNTVYLFMLYYHEHEHAHINEDNEVWSAVIILSIRHGACKFYAERLFEHPAYHASSDQRIALWYGAAKTPPIHT